MELSLIPKVMTTIKLALPGEPNKQNRAKASGWTAGSGLGGRLGFLEGS